MTGFLYYSICRFFNSTRISADRDELAVRHGPLPWPGERNRRIPAERLSGFSLAWRTERKSALAHGGTDPAAGIVFYRAEAVLEGPSSARRGLTHWAPDDEPVRELLEVLGEYYGVPVTFEGG